MNKINFRADAATSDKSAPVLTVPDGLPSLAEIEAEVTKRALAVVANVPGEEWAARLLDAESRLAEADKGWKNASEGWAEAMEGWERSTALMNEGIERHEAFRQEWHSRAWSHFRSFADVVTATLDLLDAGLVEETRAALVGLKADMHEAADVYAEFTPGSVWQSIQDQIDNNDSGDAQATDGEKN